MLRYSFSKLLLVIAAILLENTACAPVDKFLRSLEDEEAYYIEASSSVHVLRDTYLLLDSIEAKHFVFCAQYAKIDGLGKDKVIMNVNDSVISFKLRIAINRTELPIKIADEFIKLDSSQYCLGTPKIRFGEYAKRMLESEEFRFLYSKSKRPQLVTFSAFGAFWHYEYVNEAPAGWIPTDRILYRLNRRVLTAVLEHDTIAYLSCFYHRDTIMLNEVDQIEFDFPQEIMDSLMVLTLQKYKERLR